MFTGIIRHTGKIIQLKNLPQGKRVIVETVPQILDQLETGITSVAINGSCHTVESSDQHSFTVFSSFETLKRTTMSNLQRGYLVNLELPLTVNTLLDGHLVQGHVDGVGKIMHINQKGDAYLYQFSAEKQIIDYLVEKDSIAIDGISLTLYDIKDRAFSVAVIPETAEKTILATKKEGDSVNLEVNIFAKYAYQFSNRRQDKDRKLTDWLNS